MAKKKADYYDLMSEDAFQEHVIQCAVENGFVLPPLDADSPKRHRRQPQKLVYHTYDSRRSTSHGFPDLVLVHPQTGRTIFAELKKQSGYPSPEQRRWLEALRKNAGVEVYVWKPRDMPEVARVLGGWDPRLVV